jgi:hypothetical protein
MSELPMKLLRICSFCGTLAWNNEDGSDAAGTETVTPRPRFDNYPFRRHQRAELA